MQNRILNPGKVFLLAIVSLIFTARGGGAVVRYQRKNKNSAHYSKRCTLGARRACLYLVAGLAFLNAASLQAATFNQTLDYDAVNQGIWGPAGASVGFNYSNSIGFDIPLGLGTASVGYAVVANSGTVSADFDGDLKVNYIESMAAPGIANLSLSFEGKGPETSPPICFFGVCIPGIDIPSGSLNSDFGARAQLTSSVGNVGPDFTLDINRTFNPGLGNTINGSDSVTAAQVAVIDVIAAEAGVEMGVTQETSFIANAVTGDLLYSRQGSGVTNSVPFSIDESGMNLNVNLTEAGIWDFWFDDPVLDNDFSTSFFLDLGLYASTVAGCGDFLLESCEASKDLLSLKMLGIDPFPLDFGLSSDMGSFSIEVAALVSPVPVPAAFWLFATALAGFFGLGRRRKTTPMLSIAR